MIIKSVTCHRDIYPHNPVNLTSTAVSSQREKKNLPEDEWRHKVGLRLKNRQKKIHRITLVYICTYMCYCNSLSRIWPRNLSWYGTVCATVVTTLVKMSSVHPCNDTDRIIKYRTLHDSGGHSPRRPGFHSRSVYVGSVVGRVSDHFTTAQYS